MACIAGAVSLLIGCLHRFEVLGAKAPNMQAEDFPM